MEQPESLSVQYGIYEAHARSIAAGVIEAGHEAQADRVSAGQKHNWNRRGYLFCRNRCGSIPDYDGYVPLNEFSHQTWQAFIMTAGKVVFHRYVLPLDIASLFETQFERRYEGRRRAGCRARKHEPDDWNGLLPQAVTGRVSAAPSSAMKLRRFIKKHLIGKSWRSGVLRLSAL
jgi:hypothetical protein